MKKLFTVQVFLLISILFGNATLAQITITSTDVAATNALGNVITNNFDSLATFIDIGSPRATSWDFSTLKSNYTNTFTSVTPSSAPYHSSHFPNSNVMIKVFDILGNEIATLVNEEKPIGTYEITWNAVNLSSGIYFYQMKVGEFIQTKKMILMK